MKGDELTTPQKLFSGFSRKAFCQSTLSSAQILPDKKVHKTWYNNQLKEKAVIIIIPIYIRG